MLRNWLRRKQSSYADIRWNTRPVWTAVSLHASLRRAGELVTESVVEAA